MSEPKKYMVNLVQFVASARKFVHGAGSAMTADLPQGADRWTQGAGDYRMQATGCRRLQTAGDYRLQAEAGVCNRQPRLQSTYAFAVGSRSVAWPGPCPAALTEMEDLILLKKAPKKL